MFFLRHVLPAIILSIAVGFVIARFTLNPVNNYQQGATTPSTAYNESAVQPASVSSPDETTPAPSTDQITDTAAPDSSSRSQWSVDSFLKSVSEQSSSDTGVPPAASQISRDAETDYESAILEEAATTSVLPKPGRSEPAKPVAKFRSVTVRRGDTLSSISKKIYGDSKQYQRIIKANRELSENPNKLYVGQILRLPVTTSE